MSSRSVKASSVSWLEFVTPFLSTDSYTFFRTGLAKSHHTSPVILIAEFDGSPIKPFTFIAFLPISITVGGSNRLVNARQPPSPLFHLNPWPEKSMPQQPLHP